MVRRADQNELLETSLTDVLTRRGIAPVSFRRYESDFAGFSKDLGDSFVRYGFAAVEHHGLDQARIDKAIADAKAFFALPEEVKRRYKIEGAGGQRGYTPFGIETAKGAEHFDLKEFWHVGRELPPGHPFRASMPDNIWPAEIAGFKDSELWLYHALEGFGRRLLRAIAAYLKLPTDYFEDTVELGNSVLRLLHYPPAPFDGPNIRAGAHEDINTITCLLGAEEAGLEVLERSGEWLAINPPAGSIVVNIGDMLQRLTNHVLPSTTHRVRNPAGERARFSRYSMPFFLHPRSDFRIETLPGCVTPENPDRHPQGITADDYLQQRLHEIGLK